MPELLIYGRRSCQLSFYQKFGPRQEDEILRRRTFAIILHPDAIKTTLTEKLLLFGGAIQLAGEVREGGERWRMDADWMAVEREHGISVSSAECFEYEGLAFNRLGTLGTP